MHTVIVADGGRPADPRVVRLLPQRAQLPRRTAGRRRSGRRPVAADPRVGAGRTHAVRRDACARRSRRDRAPPASPSPSSANAKGPVRRCPSIRDSRSRAAAAPHHPRGNRHHAGRARREMARRHARAAPGTPGLQEKSWPIETFFHKVVMLRNRLRTLEQQVNAADLPGRREGEAAGLHQRLLRLADQLQRAVRGRGRSVQGRRRRLNYKTGTDKSRRAVSNHAGLYWRAACRRAHRCLDQGQGVGGRMQISERTVRRRGDRGRLGQGHAG